MPLRPHGLQHARLPCLSPSPRSCSDSCPLSRWCHPTISSSATPFSSCPQSFPASGSFPMRQVFVSNGHCIGVSASASVLPMNILGLIFFRIEWFDLLAVQETLKSLLYSHSSKASVLQSSAFFMVQLSHPYLITGKTIALTIQNFIYLTCYKLEKPEFDRIKIWKENLIMKFLSQRCSHFFLSIMWYLSIPWIFLFMTSPKGEDLGNFQNSN